MCTKWVDIKLFKVFFKRILRADRIPDADAELIDIYAVFQDQNDVCDAARRNNRETEDCDDPQSDSD